MSRRIDTRILKKKKKNNLESLRLVWVISLNDNTLFWLDHKLFELK